MKKHRHYRAFIGGVITALLICGCVTTALAASGNVTLNAVNLYFDGLRVSQKDETLLTTSGETIPSSILYTDDKGWNTTYIPIGEIAEAYQLPIDWDESSDKVTVSLDSEMQLHAGPAWSTDWTLNDWFKEVKSIIPQGGMTVLASTKHQSAAAFSSDVMLTDGNGRYVSVTVTNHNTKPVVFSLGHRFSDDNITHADSEIPAGVTVTRTVEIISPEGQTYNSLYVSVGYPFFVADVLVPIDITVSAVQFNG